FRPAHRPALFRSSCSTVFAHMGSGTTCSPSWWAGRSCCLALFFGGPNVLVPLGSNDFGSLGSLGAFAGVFSRTSSLSRSSLIAPLMRRLVSSRSLTRASSFSMFSSIFFSFSLVWRRGGGTYSSCARTTSRSPGGGRLRPSVGGLQPPLLRRNAHGYE